MHGTNISTKPDYVHKHKTNTTLTPRVVVRVMLIRDNKVLHMITSRNYEQYALLPGGGVEKGELYKQAAIREIHEELGKDVVINNIEYLDESITGNNVCYYYYCNESDWQGEPVLQETDCLSVPTLEWIPLNEYNQWIIDRCCSIPHKHLMAELAKILMYKRN